MRCLVTGVAGFIGSHLAERLLADGHEVVGIDAFLDYYPRSMKERNIENIRSDRRFTFVEGDVLGLALPPLLDGVDYLFHLAAQAGVRASWGMNIAGGSRVTVREVIALLEEISHSTIQVLYEQKQSGDVRDTFADISKAQQLIGYRPLTSLREGLAQEFDAMVSLYSNR